MARAVGIRCFWVHCVTPRVLRGEPVVITRVDRTGTMFWGDLIIPLAAVDAPAPAVKPRAGERWRFVVPGRYDEIVVIQDAGYGGFTGFVTADKTTVIVDPDGRPSRGSLEPVAPPAPKPEPPPKQHDQISLDEWRHKIGRMRWP